MLQIGLQTALRVLFPPTCLSCGSLVEQSNGLCPACFAEMPFITGLACSLCGVPLPGSSGHDERCDDCLAVGRPWTRGTAPMRYDGVARRLVLGLKHGDRHDIVSSASDWMVRTLPRDLPKDTLVIPVPLHLTRLLQRKYDQSALLAQAIGRRTGFTYTPDALTRVRRTASLDGKTREARFRELADSITVKDRFKAHLTDQTILLVDDVMTSGATLAACSLACHQAQVREIFVTVLARVAKDA